MPEFNEATWRHIPARCRAHLPLTGHPAAYGGVVAVFTLDGHALFRAWDDQGEEMAWDTGPGQIVIMRGAGWPENNSKCPRHEVEPPHDEERMIMTLRHNKGGAGAGYIV